METPWPRVMNPTISSPGTGVQHFASFTQISLGLMPATTIAPSRAGSWRILGCPGVTASERVSSVPSPPPRLSTSLVTTLWADTCPSPRAAYSPDTSG